MLNFVPSFNRSRFAIIPLTSWRSDMPAIRNHILRTIITLAVTSLAATAFAQTPGGPKTIKINPETAEAEVGQQLKMTLAGLEGEGKAMWIALASDISAVGGSGARTFFPCGGCPGKSGK